MATENEPDRLVAGSLQQRRDKAWALSGTVDVSTVPSLLDAARPLLANGIPAIVDLADVERIDSAGLAMLVEWRRLGDGRKVPISYRNIPRRMLPVAEACGLLPILPETCFQA